MSYRGKTRSSGPPARGKGVPRPEVRGTEAKPESNQEDPAAVPLVPVDEGERSDA